VIGHDGKATNVTMVPGDLVLYESHSFIHGVSNKARTTTS
jgi:prolyl 4-hydroxylase